MSYTPSEAGKLKAKIDDELANIEKAVAKMAALVPQAQLHTHTLAEVRSAANELKAAVDRLTF